jgi:hypothetical protein
MAWAQVAAAAIGAAGTVLSGYIALRVAQTRTIVNGRMVDLTERVERLTLQLASSRQETREIGNAVLPNSWPPADPDQAA